MTLKEKFIGYCDHQYANREDNAENCVEIADDYAIEFWNWMSENYLTYYHELSIWNKENYKYSSKELLEIFKKEKGL